MSPIHFFISGCRGPVKGAPPRGSKGSAGPGLGRQGCPACGLASARGRSRIPGLQPAEAGGAEESGNRVNLRSPIPSCGGQEAARLVTRLGGASAVAPGEYRRRTTRLALLQRRGGCAASMARLPDSGHYVTVPVDGSIGRLELASAFLPPLQENRAHALLKSPEGARPPVRISRFHRWSESIQPRNRKSF